MYRALVVSVLLYDSEAWSITLADRRRLDVFKMRCQGASCVRSGSRTVATGESSNRSIREPSINQRHHLSYDNAAYAGLDISLSVRWV